MIPSAFFAFLAVAFDSFEIRALTAIAAICFALVTAFLFWATAGLYILYQAYLDEAAPHIDSGALPPHRSSRRQEAHSSPASPISLTPRLQSGVPQTPHQNPETVSTVSSH